MDPYAVLGVSPGASRAEIREAYRMLVKRHHPDAGGGKERILALNAAWEVLGDRQRRQHHDALHGVTPGGSSASAIGRRGCSSTRSQLSLWLRQVYLPIDRLLGEVIQSFPEQLRALAADPYDDRLMESFCSFLARSRQRMEKVEILYRSRVCPTVADGFGLSLYHCLSQVQDALEELERYTMGYVDGYLHDGGEMLREASHRRSELQEKKKQLEINSSV